MVICLKRGADLHMAQLMPLPLTVSCFSKIQIGFTFLVSAHPGSPGQRAVKRMYVAVNKHDDKTAGHGDLPMGSTGIMRVAMNVSQKSICLRLAVSESSQLTTTM